MRLDESSAPKKVLNQTTTKSSAFAQKRCAKKGFSPESFESPMTDMKWRPIRGMPT